MLLIFCNIQKGSVGNERRRTSLTISQRLAAIVGSGVKKEENLVLGGLAREWVGHPIFVVFNPPFNCLPCFGAP